MKLPGIEQVKLMKIDELKNLGYTVLEDLHKNILDQFDEANLDRRIELELAIEKVEASMDVALFTVTETPVMSVKLPDRPAPKAKKLYQEGLDSNNFKKIKQSAYMGLPEAANTLGFLYESGHGTRKNPEKAFRFYTYAAEKGYPEARKNLAYCYEKGFGTQKNVKKAIEMYKLAETNGIKESAYRIGMIYKRGIGVQQDYKAALGYFTRALNDGYYRAGLVIGDMYRVGQGVEKSFARSHDSYETVLFKSREAGDRELEKIAGKRIRKLMRIPSTWFYD